MDCNVDILVFGCTSDSLIKGKEYDKFIKNKIEQYFRQASCSYGWQCC